MPSFLTKRLAGLPTWGWLVAGLGVVFLARWQQKKSAPAATTLPTQNLNPDYGPGGWPGQGAFSNAPPPPLGAISQVNQPSGSSAMNAPVYNPGNPVARAGQVASSGGFLLPRVL